MKILVANASGGCRVRDTQPTPTMNAKQIGTVFATRKQLAAMDKFAAKQDKARGEIGAKDLAHLEKRTECGEVRYYEGATKYAIITRAMKVIWFELRGKDWLSIRA